MRHYKRWKFHKDCDSNRRECCAVYTYANLFYADGENSKIVCGIEFLQLALSLLYGFAYRSFDVDDLLLNGIGVMAGYCFYRIAAKTQTARRIV